ncbi:MAG: hypothetical protein US30_C0012G0014 [Candidatus Moranbacteria bacterium GW2011_GWF2_36_839]|nr:MAG: hypothetical protein US27_C0015G0013 [Candidatus Moranbacteria bacterium GW2011_GWF1_36_78]KKQ16704.1 MAG: hypothetical protein US30_C0012G0014 [Candidatus Moranbacteria bacterium GW2011_GWF2_36_839]HAT74217.1 hypothetical protein [Candidatus Moranbacteria bacterium]HBY11415.1 hypothetical protein [Candidatus Moranbacteria bacterium]
MAIIGNFIQNNATLIFLVFFGLFLLFLLWITLLQIQLSKLKNKNKTFFAESSVKNIEELILAHSKNLKLLDKDIQELYNISNQINNLASRGFHKFALIRFNPFKDVGGDQSFSLALLNGKNDGITISSLFTREGARIYSKSIISGISEKHPLTEEEKEAIVLAMKNQKIK